MGQPSPALIEAHELGQMVTITATVLGTDGLTPVSPSYFAFLVENPQGAVATYVFGAPGASVLNPGVGAFSKDVSVDPTVGNVGSWFYRSVATGKVQAAEEWSFLVKASRFVF